MGGRGQRNEQLSVAGVLLLVDGVRAECCGHAAGCNKRSIDSEKTCL